MKFEEYFWITHDNYIVIFFSSIWTACFFSWVTLAAFSIQMLSLFLSIVRTEMRLMLTAKVKLYNEK
jgi:hypothetical protein